MTQRLASTTRTADPNWFLRAEFATVGSVVAAGLEIVNGAIQSPTTYGVVLFILAMILGTGALIWFNRGRAGSDNVMQIVVSLIVVSVLIYAFRSMVAEGMFPVKPVGQKASRAITPPPPPPYYYINVQTFEGDMDGAEKPREGMTVTTRDPTDATTSHRTGPGGRRLILVRNAGEIVIAVCGVYETHNIPATSTDLAHATTIRISLTPAVIAGCN